MQQQFSPDGLHELAAEISVKFKQGLEGKYSCLCRLVYDIIGRLHHRRRNIFDNRHYQASV